MRVIRIGRRPDNDYVISDPYVGGFHLQLVQENGGEWYAVDLNSTNGTYINGRRIIGKVRLHEYDEIRIGRTNLPWRTWISSVASGTNSPSSGAYTVSGDNNKVKDNTILYVLLSVTVFLLLGGAAVLFFRPKQKPVTEPVTGVVSNVPRPSNSNVSSGAADGVAGNTSRLVKQKPSIAFMTNDLVGHKLSEGIENGYHKEDWTYLIENGSISNFRIEQTLVDDARDYVVTASFHLKGGNNFYYDAKAKISYMNDGNGWALNYVQSLGLYVISDGQYNDFIRCDIVDDGWGGVNCLKIRNLSECTLVVGGHIRNYDGWMKFSRPVGPHEASSIGGTFAGGSVTDYVVDFVVREK